MKHPRILFLIAAVTLTAAPGMVRAKADDPDPVFPPGGKKHVSDWIKELRDDDLKARHRALLALQAIGPKPRAVVPALCGALAGDKDAEIRSEAAGVLGEFGRSAADATTMRDAIEALRAALAGEKKDKEDRVREAAASALGRMGPLGSEARPAYPALVEALKDKAGIQIAAAASIDRLYAAEVKADAADVAAAMIELLKNPAAQTLARCTAATFVARHNIEGSVAALTEVLADENVQPRLRQTSAEVLGRFKENADSAVPALAKALKDKNVDVRIAAGTTLARIGSRAKDALPQVRQALRDEDGNVRNRAINVIATLGPDAADALADLIVCLKGEKVVENKVAALQALGQMGSSAKDAVGLVTEFARSPNATVKEAATEALKKIE